MGSNVSAVPAAAAAATAAAAAAAESAVAAAAGKNSDVFERFRTFSDVFGRF